MLSVFSRLSRNIPVVFGKQFTTSYENTEDISGANGCLLSDQPALQCQEESPGQLGQDISGV